MNKSLLSQIAVIIIWILSFFLLFTRGLWFIPLGLFLIHLLELILVGLQTGKDNKKSLYYTVIMTLIFGVTWWGPLKRRSQ